MKKCHDIIFDSSHSFKNKRHLKKELSYVSIKNYIVLNIFDALFLLNNNTLYSSCAMISSIVSISIGASLGALSRWLLSLWLNSIYPPIPLGTLCVNVLGSLLIGCMTALLLIYTQIPVNIKLFCLTGFLGSFTTFSTFSAEMGLLIQNKDYLHAFLGIGAHLFLSLCAFFIGMIIVNVLHNALVK